jgi:vacuolar-type H+-ATPase subunit I/STV1
VCEKQKKGEGGTDCTSAENALPSSSAGQRGRREISGAIKRERAHNQEKKAGDNTQKKKQEKKENFNLNSEKKNSQEKKKVDKADSSSETEFAMYMQGWVGDKRQRRKKKLPKQRERML